jgi:hypothetical protein
MKAMLNSRMICNLHKLCSGSKNICINFALLNLQIRQISTYFATLTLLELCKIICFPSLCSGISSACCANKVLFWFNFYETLFTFGFYCKMDKEIDTPYCWMSLDIYQLLRVQHIIFFCICHRNS